MNMLIVFCFLISILIGCSQEPISEVSDNTVNAQSDENLTQEHDGKTIDEIAEAIANQPVSDEQSQSSATNDSGAPNNSPESPMITINSSEYTQSQTVSLQLSAVGAKTMYITNTPGCLSGGTWEAYATTKTPWELEAVNTLARVYVKYKNEAGNETPCVEDDITHDDTPPSDIPSIDDGIETLLSTESPNFTWQEAIDLTSAIDYYEVSIGLQPEGSSVKAWEKVGNISAIKFDNLNLTANTTYFANIRAIDLAGNVSNTLSSDGFYFNFCHSIGEPGSWVLVPADSNYNTKDFCIMKYEARCSQDDGQACTANLANESPVSKPMGTPWVSISQQDAISACASLGEGFQLVTNAQWMAIGSNIASIGSNWSNDAVGQGQLIRGHSDNSPNRICPASADDQLNVVEANCDNLSADNDDFIEQRTHILSNQHLIWDLSGNAAEWVNYYELSDRPTPLSGGNWSQFPVVVGSSSTPLQDLIPQVAIDGNWDSGQSIGQYRSGAEGAGGAMLRGAYRQSGGFAGLFSTDLYFPPTQVRADFGFRCSFTLP